MIHHAERSAAISPYWRLALHYLQLLRRQKFLDSVRRRDLFLEILEQVRAKHDFVVAGYGVMPEHLHLLISEPRIGKLSSVLQILKQRVSRRCRNQNEGVLIS